MSNQCLNFDLQEEILHNYSTEDYIFSVLFPQHEIEIKFKKGWNIFKSHYHFKDLKKFIFIEKLVSLNDKRIFLINIESFKELVNENLKIFKYFLKKDITPKSFFNEFCSDIPLWDVLNNSEALLGILLGYGTHNALLFQKRENLEKLMKNPVFSSEYIHKKYKKLNKRMRSINPYHPEILFLINKSGFIVDAAHCDTPKIQKDYFKQHEMLVEMRSRGNWFETILAKLCED